MFYGLIQLAILMLLTLIKNSPIFIKYGFQQWYLQSTGLSIIKPQVVRILSVPLIIIIININFINIIFLTNSHISEMGFNNHIYNLL